MTDREYRCVSCDKLVVVSKKASLSRRMESEKCLDCYVDSRHNFANRMMAGHGLPELKGASKAQIDYATSVRAQVIVKVFSPNEYDKFGSDKLPGLHCYKFEKEIDSSLFRRVAYMNSAQWWLNLLSDTPAKKQKHEKLSERLHDTCSNDEIIGKVSEIDFEVIDEMSEDWDKFDLNSDLPD